MKTAHIEAKKKVLIEKREKLIEQFDDAARARKDTTRFETGIRRTNEYLSTLDRIVQENTRKPGEPRRYAVSSLFLHECFKKLTADPDEQFFFITARRSRACTSSTSARNLRTSAAAGLASWPTCRPRTIC